MGFLIVEIQDREMFKETDTRIKLFGKTIQQLEIPPLAMDEVGGADHDQSCDAADDVSSILDRPCSSNSEIGDITSGMDTDEEGSTKYLSGQKLENSDVKDDAQPLTSEELNDSNVTCPANDDSNAPSTDNYAATMKSSKTGDDPTETITSQEKTLKKPDKIVPCPRCNSMDTKFCYFNNYNVTQHRHFCKKCQRYWTAGGTMRSMPVGAGRRKNKNAAAHHRYQMDSEALQNAPNGIHQPGSNPYLSGSSDSAPNSNNKVGKSWLPDPQMQNFHSFTPQVPCFSGAPFPYPFNSIQWRAQVSTSAYGPSSFPVPFYPTAPFWGCPVPDPWNVSWVIPPTSHNHKPLGSGSGSGSGPDSPTLGKHSRDDDTLKPASNYEEDTKRESNCEKRLWVPKTLRIDDPEEAAMSSIWATLGITNERVDSFGGRGLLNAFQRLSKDDEKRTHVSETSTVLRANPAALSRSLNFHESS